MTHPPDESWKSVAGVSSSSPPARLHPNLGLFLVVELSVVHAVVTRMSQTGSIGDKSGDRAGQSR